MTSDEQARVERLLMVVATEPPPESVRRRIFTTRPRRSLGALLPLAAAALLLAGLLALVLLPPSRSNPHPTDVSRRRDDPVETLVARWLAGEIPPSKVEWLGTKALPALARHLHRKEARTLYESLRARPIRVLYVEGAPRYEYRFLKNYLIRDRAFLVHCFLTTAEDGFPQERSLHSDDPRFRQSLVSIPEDLTGYDVLILGDVPAAALGGEQAAKRVRSFVREYGGGLALISGVGGPNPGLADLTPVVEKPPVETEFNRPEPPVISDRDHPILRHAWKDRPVDSLPGIRWHRLLDRVKAEAQVLARLDPEKTPLFVSWSAGRGRVFWSGTDETWTWRHGVGDEPWFAPFHRAVLRWCAGTIAPLEDERIRSADLILKGTIRQVEQIQGGVIDYHHLLVRFERVEVIQSRGGTEAEMKILQGERYFIPLRGSNRNSAFARELKDRLQAVGKSESIWIWTRVSADQLEYFDWLRLPISEEGRVREILRQ